MVIEQKIGSAEKTLIAETFLASSYRRWLLIPFFVVAVGLPFIVPHSVAYILVFGLLFIAPIPFLRRWQERAVKKALARFPEEQRFELDSKGITLIGLSDHSLAAKAWDAIAQIKETESYYFLAVRDGGFWVIKKKPLSHDQAEGIRSLFKKYVPVFHEASPRVAKQAAASLH